jgi:hypothetical protein
MDERRDDHQLDNEPDCTAADPDQLPRGLLFIGDVQALRRAERVSLHASDGVGCIHADLSGPAGGEPRIYTATQQRLFPEPVGHDRTRRIAVAADIAGFDAQRRWHDHQLPGATATAQLATAPFHEVWRSVAAFLRVGDVLRLRWHADHNSDPLAGHCLHRDDLTIQVRRGQRLWTFLLDITVRPAHQRMVTTATPQ